MKNLIICMLAFLTAGALASCSDDNPASTGQGQKDGSGEVSFEISNESGTGLSCRGLPRGYAQYGHQPEEQLY